MKSEPTVAWHPRRVFFTADAGRASSFYTERLGFTLDWSYDHDGRPFVFQVSLNGVELIVNQAEGNTATRPGHGRVFIGLDDTQVENGRQG